MNIITVILCDSLDSLFNNDIGNSSFYSCFNIFVKNAGTLVGGDMESVRPWSFSLHELWDINIYVEFIFKNTGINIDIDYIFQFTAIHAGTFYL